MSENFRSCIGVSLIRYFIVVQENDVFIYILLSNCFVVHIRDISYIRWIVFICWCSHFSVFWVFHLVLNYVILLLCGNYFASWDAVSWLSSTRKTQFITIHGHFKNRTGETLLLFFSGFVYVAPDYSHH